MAKLSTATTINVKWHIKFVNQLILLFYVISLLPFNKPNNYPRRDAVQVFKPNDMHALYHCSSNYYIHTLGVVCFVVKVIKVHNS